MTGACRMRQAAGHQHAELVRQSNDRGMQNDSGSRMTGEYKMSQAVQWQRHAEGVR